MIFKMILKFKNTFCKNLFSIKIASKILILSFVFLVFSSIANSPDGKNDEIQLFKIERNRDSNEVIYTLKLAGNKIRKCKNPIHVFWQSTDKTTKSLTFVQQKYGYGTSIIKEFENEILFTIAALPLQIFVAKAMKNNKIKTFTIIDKQEVEVNSIYISFVENTKWLAQIAYLELNGTETATNTKIIKTIHP